MNDTSFNIRARGYDCPQCPATADEPCRTPSGAKAVHSHHQRVKRAKAAYATADNDPSFDLRARKYACPLCGVGAGKPCRTPQGKAAPHSHGERCAIARDHAEGVARLARGMGIQQDPPLYARPVDGPYVRMAGTTAHVYLPAGTDHVIIGYLEA